jgi:hypothetical protein
VSPSCFNEPEAARPSHYQGLILPPALRNEYRGMAFVLRIPSSAAFTAGVQDADQPLPFFITTGVGVMAQHIRAAPTGESTIGAAPTP